MQRERYTYPYTENYVPHFFDTDEYNPIINENRHFFSVLNLSMGYERSLSDRWSLQVEPYLKAPLSGVGAGKVKLTSAGVFFGLKYGL
jgi:hypothetical protein